MSRITLLATTPFALLALAACGRDGGPEDPSPLPAIDSTLDLAFANTTTNLMQRVLHVVYGGQDLATPNPFILPSLGAPRPAPAPERVVAACVPVQTGVDSLGVALDSDADGIPDDLTVDFGVACIIPAGPVEYTFSGKYRLRDPGTGILDWQYTTTELSAMVRDTLTGDFFRQMVTGLEGAQFTEGEGAHQMDVTLEVTSRSGADSSHVKLRTNTGSTYVPTAGSIFQVGGTLPQGTLGLGAELTFRDLAAGTDSLRFAIANPTPIHTSFGCESGIDAGKLEGFFEGDLRVGFRYTWGACADPLLELFGTTP